MPKGVYPRTPRTAAAENASLAARLLEMSVPEPNTGCWLFLGYVDRNGYGAIARNKQVRVKAHRASFSVFRCDVPKEMDVMHRCDTRCCINPDHLILGTHGDNMADMARKRRANNRYTGKRII